MFKVTFVFAIISCCSFVDCTLDYYVVAPNMFRFGVEETVSVFMYGLKQSVDVEIILQDYPGRRIISEKTATIENDQVSETKVIVNPSDISDVLLNDPNAKIYCYLVVKCTSPQISFTKESFILMSPHKGYIFIQTDKPIYTPRQEARIRIMPLGQDLRPMKTPFKVKIFNPQNITVRNTDYSKSNREGIITEIFKFPRNALEGLWGVSVLHGHEFSSTKYVSFEVKKYVLPTFDVKVLLPETIMEDFQEIRGAVESRYVYDKPVMGAVKLRYGVKAINGEISYIPDDTKVEVKPINGKAQFSIPLQLVKDKFNAFPQGHRFHVEATVIEGVSGKEFTQIHENTYFQKSPYIIDFKRTKKNFKIGLIAHIQVQVKYASKVPVNDLDVEFTVKTADGLALPITNKKRKTDASGFVILKISVPPTTKLTVYVKTVDPKLKASQQASEDLTMLPYQSPSGGYLSIKPPEAGTKLKKGFQYDGIVIVNPWQHVNRVMFAVISKGKVVALGRTSTKDGKNTLERTFSFMVSDEMIPSVRIVTFTNYKNQLIADSTWMDVEDVCQHDVETTITPTFDFKEPGQTGIIKIKADRQSTVGLLTVDKAVYVLRNEGRLTSQKVYESMEKYDIGCGPGGGIDTVSVLKKSGLIILTASNVANVKREHFNCIDLVRTKREVVEEAEKYKDPFIKSCCLMGQKPTKFSATCEQRKAVLHELLARKYPNKIECSQAFYNCCRTVVSLARSGLEDGLDFVTDLEKFERDVQVRSFFPESWLYEEIKMQNNTEISIPINLPHSITTWVFQAFSVSPTRGLCVAEPQNIVVQKGVFLDVNIPYSVVRNEEVEIKVSIFNYRKRAVPVTVFMYGVEGICTGAEVGKRTPSRRIIVPPQNAVATPFFIIPLEMGKFKLKFVALSELNSDAVEKDLNVRAEGVIEYQDRSVTLDPSNYNGIPGSSIWITEDDGYSNFLDTKNKKHFISLPIIPPKNSILETESAMLEIIGDSFGPTVKTAFTQNELGKYINKPRGCGEQNMMLMAPCLYTMKYLRATGKLGANEEKSGYKWIRLGYERQLNFRKPDGGYSAGKSRATSTWLTAFVMKCFCQADSFINVDSVVGCTGIQWLVNSQRDDGSFEDKFPVYHKEMTGGVSGRFAMTAFVLMSLSECTKCQINGLADTKKKAVAYLETGIMSKKRPYEYAVAVYALHLARSSKQKEALKLLKDSSIYDPKTKQRHWEIGNGALSIEATAYALLTLVLNKDLQYAKPVVNWLNANRGIGGVWKSTQDTVVALQAMSEYAIISRQPNINLVVNITSETDAKFSKSFKINNNNFQELQSVEVIKPGGLVFIDAYGEGTAQLSMRMQYNIPIPPEAVCAFNLTVTAEEVIEEIKAKALQGIQNNVLEDLPEDVQRTVGVRNQADVFEKILVEGDDEEEDPRDRSGIKKKKTTPLLKIKICTQFKGPEEETSMAIIDVGIFTGYSVIEDDVDKLVNEVNSPIQQYELSSKGITFYLDSISKNTETCIEFRAKQDTRIGNAHKASVVVYDYYQPKYKCTAFYEPGESSVIKKSICIGNFACVCPKGGCSPCNVFEDMLDSIKTNFRKMTRELLHQTCNEHDYVWIVSVIDIRMENELKMIDVKIKEIIKPGAESTSNQLRKESVRTLITYKHCDCPSFKLGHTYFIMGQDGNKWMNNGVAKYRYIINPSAKVFESKLLRQTAPENRLIMKSFNWLQNRFVKYKKGCGQ